MAHSYRVIILKIYSNIVAISFIRIHLFVQYAICCFHDFDISFPFLIVIFKSIIMLRDIRKYLDFTVFLVTLCSQFLHFYRYYLEKSRGLFFFWNIPVLSKSVCLNANGYLDDKYSCDLII